MASDWYYARRGDPAAAQAGPLTWEELYARARAGALGADDLVWNPQLPEWLPAGQIPGLLPESAVAAPTVSPVTTAAAPVPVGSPYPPAAYSPGAYPIAAQSPAPRRRASLLTWLIPLIAIIIVGAALGSYFGFFYHHDRDNGTAVSTTASSTAGGQTTSTTKAQTAGVGTVELTVPDEANLVTTTKWGEVPVNEIGVVLADGKTRADADQIAQQLGGTVVGQLDFLNLSTRSSPSPASSLPSPTKRTPPTKRSGGYVRARSTIPPTAVNTGKATLSSGRRRLGTTSRAPASISLR
jgi:hypothetical protein